MTQKLSVTSSARVGEQPLVAASARMRRRRLLHRATDVVAAALMAHVLLIGDVGLGFALIALGFVARIPAVRRWMQRRSDRRRLGQPAPSGELVGPSVPSTHRTSTVSRPSPPR